MGYGIHESIRMLRERPDDEVKIKCPLEAGLLMRGTVRNWVEYAKSKGLVVHDFENWGLIDSSFVVEIEGKAGDIADALSLLPVE